MSSWVEQAWEGGRPLLARGGRRGRRPGLRNRKGIPGETRQTKRGPATRYRAYFHWLGRNYSRLCRRKREAESLAKAANDALDLLRRELLEIPPGANREQLKKFIFSGGKVAPADPPRRLRAATTTISELLDDYLEQGAPPAKVASSYATERIHIAHLRDYLALPRVKLKRAPVGELTRGVIKRYRKWRQDLVGNVTINKEVATFHAVFTLAVDDGMVQANPIARLKRLKIAKLSEFNTLDEIERLLREGACSTPEEEKRLRKARILYPGEIEELLELAEGRTVYIPLCIAIFTGARRGEIARLTWADARFEQGEGQGKIVLHSRKQSQEVEWTPRPVGIHSKLLPILQEHKLKTGGEGYMFPGREIGTHISPQTLHTNLKKVIEGTSFAGIAWHTLRHSFASNMARVGTDQRVINQIMGHTSDAMARRYRHLFPEQHQSAIEDVYKTA